MAYHGLLVPLPRKPGRRSEKFPEGFPEKPRQIVEFFKNELSIVSPELLLHGSRLYC